MSEPDLDPESTRYLLGEMAAGERDAFEERFLADDDQQGLVTATERELFAAYADDALPHVRKRRFEATFLRDESGAHKLAAARALLTAARRAPLAPPRRLSTRISAQMVAVQRAASRGWLLVGGAAAIVACALAVALVAC